MKPPSIRQRIFRGVAVVSLLTTALMYLATFVAYEDMEAAMLNLIFAEEEAFFLSHLDRRNGEAIVTDNLVVAYIPPDSTQAPPSLFSGLASPYRGELHHAGRTYMVHVERIEDGTLYLAKDITPFERREWLFRGMLAAIALAAIAFALLLARLTAQRIAQPMSRLATAVRSLVPGRPGPARDGFPTDFREAEMQDIALAFDRYLDELDRLMQRERRLLGMASHEFRTPVAVIAGALDVIERNGETDDAVRRRALARIRLAADEMRSQIDAILALSRTPAGSVPGRTDMAEIVDSVIGDLAAAGLPAGRIGWSPPAAPVEALADPVLAKMLVRNLVHNALQHTGGEVAIELEQGSLAVSDCGPGLPDSFRSLLGSAGKSQSPQDGALGLYLVTLIAERLGWRLNASQAEQDGTAVTVSWKIDAL